MSPRPPDRPGAPERMSRRAFLGATVGLVVAACSGDDDPTGADALPGADPPDPPTTTTVPPLTTTTAAPPTTMAAVTPVPAADVELPGEPFTLGVASGDPLPDAVVLWTRLAPAEGPIRSDLDVAWDVATDASFTHVVASGTASALGEHAHAVHVDVTGLPADATYWYRFRVGAATSPAGRTRTAPAAGAPVSEVRLAVSSCQRYDTGFWSSHRHLAADDVHAVVWLGDYIYEDGSGSSALREHTGGRCRTLDEYRDRYALYRRDADLAAAHAAHPWIVTWDDHEVANGYAGLSPGTDGSDPDAFPDRRAAAYKAWWEHMPVRRDPPTGPDLEIHRSLGFGDIAQVFVLDGRQHRTPQPCGYPDSGPVARRCPGAEAEEATMLGADQEAWLAAGLATSTSRWNVLANQTVLTSLPLLDFYNMDQWDGYVAARRRLVEAVPAGANVVVVTGDIHAAAVADVRSAPDAPVTVTELVAPPTSSPFPADRADLVRAAVALDDDVHWFDTAAHGYLRATFSPTQCIVEFRHVTEVTDPGSGIGTAATYRIDAGRAGAIET